MPKISEMLESKFLRKEDVERPALFTITGCEQFNIAKEGVEPQMKWGLTFKESEKPLILNVTNLQMCSKIFASDDSDEWIGKQIVLYDDPSVMYKGEIRGGIRVRAPKVKTAKPVPKPVAKAADDDEEFDGQF